MERWVRGDAGTLRVDDEGFGSPPLLFLHGLAGRLELWGEQLAHLRWTHRAAAFDLRGMGESSAPSDGDYSLEAMAGDVDAIADALGLERFVLVAHGEAGMVAGTYAGACPERLAGLALVDASGMTSTLKPELVEHIRRELHHDYHDFTTDWFGHQLVGAAPHTVGAVMAALRATRPSVYVAAFEESLSYDPMKTLARFQGPRLAIVAEQNDSPLAVHHRVKGFDERRVRGVSHWLMLDRPEEVNAHLDEFLASLPRETPAEAR